MRVGYSLDGECGRGWFRGLIEGLADDGIVDVEASHGETITRLQR